MTTGPEGGKKQQQRQASGPPSNRGHTSPGAQRPNKGKGHSNLSLWTLSGVLSQSSLVGTLSRTPEESPCAKGHTKGPLCVVAKSAGGTGGPPEARRAEGCVVCGRRPRPRIWSILPVVICFVQGLSHAYLSAHGLWTVDLWMAPYISSHFRDRVWLALWKCPMGHPPKPGG